MLCITVMSAWDELESSKLENVYACWKLVLVLIIKDNRGNRLIEAKRGKCYQAKDLDKESTRCVADDVNLTLEDIDRRNQGLD